MNLLKHYEEDRYFRRSASPPYCSRKSPFSQARDYVAAFGGSETNVAVSLANFGIPTEFVTRLPDNEIARACVSDLRSHGLRTDGIIYGGDRMGIYFLENGASFRNSKVVYDRAGSSFPHFVPG